MIPAKQPCPICSDPMFIVGSDRKDGSKITSCSHSYSFKKTKAQKMMDREFNTFPWGLERKV